MDPPNLGFGVARSVTEVGDFFYSSIVIYAIVKALRFRSVKPRVIRQGSTSVPPVGYISREQLSPLCNWIAQSTTDALVRVRIKCAISISVIIPDCPSGESGSTPLWRVTA